MGVDLSSSVTSGADRVILVSIAFKNKYTPKNTPKPQPKQKDPNNPSRKNKHY